jgi:hypothetical protein
VSSNLISQNKTQANMAQEHRDQVFVVAIQEKDILTPPFAHSSDGELSNDPKTTQASASRSF